MDDRLYFMGGNYTFVASTGQNSSYMPYLYWLALDQSFPAEDNIPLSSINVISIDPAVNGAVEAALNGGGGLFYDNDTTYVYAGSSNSRQDNVLAAYNTSSSVWSNVSVSGGNFNRGSRSSGSTVSIPESGMSFFLGGGTPDLPGLLQLDTADPAALSWQNQTLSSGSYGVEVPNLVGFSLTYVPAGQQGVLVAFGGSNVRQVSLRYISIRQ